MRIEEQAFVQSEYGSLSIKNGSEYSKPSWIETTVDIDYDKSKQYNSDTETRADEENADAFEIRESGRGF